MPVELSAERASRARSTSPAEETRCCLLLLFLLLQSASSVRLSFHLFLLFCLFFLFLPLLPHLPRGRSPGGTSTLSGVSTAYFIQQGRIAQMALQSSAERLQLLQDVVGGTSFDAKAKEIQTLLKCGKREAERVQEQVESLGKKFDEMTEERKELRECLALEAEKERIEYVIAGTCLHTCVCLWVPPPQSICSTGHTTYSGMHISVCMHRCVCTRVYVVLSMPCTCRRYRQTHVHIRMHACMYIQVLYLSA